MQLLRDWDLQPLNTLAVPARAEYFCTVQSPGELNEALQWCRDHRQPLNLLGGGSNVVLAQRLAGLTLQIQLLGKQVLEETDTEVVVGISAGENWHQLVVWCLQNGFYGLENLALIPGTVGAAPVQNIGAYGVEISRFIEQVNAVSRADSTVISLSQAQCEFAYRDSVFKQRFRDQLVIIDIVLRLSRQPSVELSYPALRDALIGDPTPQSIFAAVCELRRSKLPDPTQTPNCGSFFKNPIVPWDLYQKLQRQYPHMPSYPASIDAAPVRKLAAAWLIDQAGWKGKSQYGASVHHQQALVLTNPQRQRAQAVLDLAGEIQRSVAARFDVHLEMEPQLLGF